MDTKDTQPRKLKLAGFELSYVHLALIAAGIILIVAGVFAYQIGLSGSRGFSSGKLVIVGMGVLVLSFGVLGRRWLDVYKNAAVLGLNTLVLLVFIEASLQVLARVRDFLPRQDAPTSEESHTEYVDDGRENLPYYREQDWGAQYWREYHAARGENRLYTPYIVWQGREFSGRTLNIDADGLRVTPNSECDEDSYTIFVFGGSTVWGTGVPDWGTIPALLQDELEALDGRAVCVINYGEEGFVSTQDTLRFTLLVQQGKIPDLAIFYAGVNDVMAAYQNGRAGDHQNLSVVAARFEERPEEPPLKTLLAKTRIYRLLSGFGSASDDTAQSAAANTDIDMTDLGADVSRVFAGNYEIVEALANTYDVDFLFIWQPYLVPDMKQLTEEEASIKGVFTGIYPGVSDLSFAANDYAAEASGNYGNMYTFTDIFADETELVYIDPFHVTMEGNAIITQKILSLFNQIN